VKIPSERHCRELAELLTLAFDDATSSWHLEADGTWRRHATDDSGAPLRDMQDHLIAVHRRRRETAHRRG